RRHTRSDRDWSSDCALPISASNEIATDFADIISLCRLIDSFISAPNEDVHLLLLPPFFDALSLPIGGSLFGAPAHAPVMPEFPRSEERRVGKEWSTVLWQVR